MSSNSAVRPNGPASGSEAESQVSRTAVRQDNAIYQNDRPVAKALDAEVDLEAREIRFGELYESDYLLLADECEYQKFRILVQKVAFASRVDKNAPDKGRGLRGVVADILGFREQ